MRQVPHHYLFIGSGRVARHFSHYWRLLNLPFDCWSRRTDPEAKLLPGLIEQADRVVLLISDNAIEPLIQQHALLQQRICIHCSGSLNTALAFSAHPLMTFTSSLYAADVYTRMPFIIEKDRVDFAELFPELPNPHFAVAREDKPLYHALCVLAGNFSCLLWQKLFNEFATRWQIPAQAVQPYLMQIFHNLTTDWQHALTGPLARHDQTTLQNNIAALADDPYQEVYQAFIKAYRVTIQQDTK